VPDAETILKIFKRGNGTFKNEVCRIEYTGERVTDFASFKPPLFGAQLKFELEEVVNCPEYLAYFPLMAKILEELGMELVYSYTFPDALDYYLKTKGRDAQNLMARMKALECYPPIPSAELST